MFQDMRQCDSDCDSVILFPHGNICNCMQICKYTNTCKEIKYGGVQRPMSIEHTIVQRRAASVSFHYFLFLRSRIVRSTVCCVSLSLRPCPCHACVCAPHPLRHCVSCAASLCRSVGAHCARCVCAMLCVCLSKERKLAIVIETLWFAARDFLT